MIKQISNLSDTVIVQLSDVMSMLNGHFVRIHCVSNDNAVVVEDYVRFEARCILQVLEDLIHLIRLVVGHFVMEVMRAMKEQVVNEARDEKYVHVGRDAVSLLMLREEEKNALFLILASPKRNQS